MLLLDANRVVSVGRLVEAAWDSGPPAGAEKAVRNSVSALRRRFTEAGVPETVIITESAGYRLHLGNAHLDAEEFKHGVAEAGRLAGTGKVADAVDTLHHALGLWRGLALTGVDGPVIRAGADRLNEQRLTATEQCLNLELTLGCHREVVSELQALVGEWPLREQLACQLMLALYRSGRQAEALDAYHRLRDRLANDLGIDPSGDAVRLHEAILRQDPWLNCQSGRPSPTNGAGDGVLRASRQSVSAAAQNGAAHTAVVDSESREDQPSGAPPLPVHSPSNVVSFASRAHRRRWWLVAAVATVVVVAVAAVLAFAGQRNALALARDGSDPYVDGCGPDQKAMAWEPIAFPDHKPYGILTMFYSAACQATWGYVYGPNSPSWTVHIAAVRGADKMTAPSAYSGKAKPNSWGNVLSTRPGCVFIEAFITNAAGKGPVATTPCVQGSGILRHGT